MIPSLKQNDKIALIAPARKIDKEEIENSVRLFEKWELEVVFGQHLFGSFHQFSGTDEERISDFQWALDQPEIKAIVCVRGGYGSVRLINKLDFTMFLKNPKWIIGYSDVTVFHNHIQQNFNLPSLHSAMPIDFSTSSPNAFDSIKKVLFGEPLNYEIASHNLNRKGKGKGILVGGNLSIIYSLLGSQSQLATAGKILFLEDIDEYLYHIDRMMMGLKRAGMLKNLNGLVVGAMTKMNDNAIPFGKTAQEIIYQTVEGYNYPVCFDFPAGHVKDNRALIMGREALLEVNDNVKLEWV